MGMFKELISRNKKIAIVGLGYVGLPLAKLLSSKYDVIGFDIDEKKINAYKKGIDIIEGENLSNMNIEFTTDEKKLNESHFIIITVPTPIKENKIPDLSFVESSTEIVGQNMPKGAIVVYESTVYPGVTEEICVPILEKESGMKCGRDFKVGYSPERVNPGKNNKTIEEITKIVSGIDDESLEVISKVYDSVLNNGIYKAKSIKIAEAAKITENIQRDVNIALINELSKIFNEMDININDVLDAAATKWNFTRYEPGLVGGHCIGIDPYYLIYKSQDIDCSSELMQTSRKVNESMIDYVYNNIDLLLNKNNKTMNNADILILGVTFKENCNDIRNSKIIDVIKKLKDNNANITLNDPNAIPEELEMIYGLKLTEELTGKFDVIIIGVAHSEYKELDYEKIIELSKEKAIIIDLKELLRNKLENMENIDYWSL